MRRGKDRAKERIIDEIDSLVDMVECDVDEIKLGEVGE
jgi:hypothetical protein